MSPIQKIKEAFQSQDWSIIQEAYKDLTGQDLESEQPKKKKSKKVSNPLKAEEPVVLQTKPENQETFTTIKGSQNSVRPPEKFIGDDGKEHTRCGIEQIDLSKSKINLFEDDLTLESNFIGKPNRPVKTVKQTTRPGYNDSLVEAQCKGCDRFFKVQKEFASHYRCDGCMIRR